MGTGFGFKVFKKFWNSMVAEVARIMNVTNATGLYTLKWYMVHFGKI